MTRLDEIRELIAFNRWANRKILEAAAALSDEERRRDLRSSYPSVHDTLLHMLSADWVWLQRLNGSSPSDMPEAWKTASWRVLREAWEEVEAGFESFVASATAEDLNRTVTYRNTAGQPFSSTLAQILLHGVNHSSYHRGQVTTLLRQLGATPPGTDLIRYYRATGDAGAAS